LLAILILGGVVSFVAARPLVEILFGKDYTDSIPSFQYLIVGYVLWGAASTLSMDLAGRGRVLLNSIFGLVLLSLNITGNIILIPRMGIDGAAITTSLSMMVGFVLFVFAYKKYTKVRYRELFIIKKSDLSYYKYTFNKIIQKMSKKTR